MTALSTEEEVAARYHNRPVPVIRRQTVEPGRVNLVDRRGMVVALAAMDPGKGTTGRTWTWTMSFGLSWRGGGPVSGESRPGLLACIEEVSALMEERGLEGVERIVSGPSSLRTFTVYVREGQSRINADDIAEAMHNARIPLLSVSEQFEHRKGRPA